jgi:serine/threonine protein phosphatase 1
VYAIGDIHGRLDLLEELLGKIFTDDEARRPAETLLIFLGDLIDRGPDSCGVVQRLLELSRSDHPARFLMGNHEELFLKALDGDVAATRYLLKFGGKATVLSYGVSESEYNEATFEDLTELIASRVPEEHRRFLQSFESRIIVGDFLFVHAGIRPGISLDEQIESDLRWIRGEFLRHTDNHGLMVVHGHSISEEVELLHNRIGIDTGAYATGRLTCVGLEDDQSWILSTGAGT